MNVNRERASGWYTRRLEQLRPKSSLRSSQALSASELERGWRRKLLETKRRVVEQATRGRSVFPHTLARTSAAAGRKIISTKSEESEGGGGGFLEEQIVELSAYEKAFLQPPLGIKF